ncbi:MAG: hypothetical protein LC744_06750 [Chloroflexi bacterium]|nr:hypothetical protein [Chloroflexota bacterium]
MRIDLVTIFPELVEVPLRTSIIGRAAENGLVTFGVHDLREHGLGRHRLIYSPLTDEVFITWQSESD